MDSVDGGFSRDSDDFLCCPPYLLSEQQSSETQTALGTKPNAQVDTGHAGQVDGPDGGLSLVPPIQPGPSAEFRAPPTHSHAVFIAWGMNPSRGAIPTSQRTKQRERERTGSGLSGMRLMIVIQHGEIRLAN